MNEQEGKEGQEFQPGYPAPTNGEMFRRLFYEKGIPKIGVQVIRGIDRMGDLVYTIRFPASIVEDDKMQAHWERDVVGEVGDRGGHEV